MRGIIFTILAGINCIACIGLTILHIITLPKKLQPISNDNERKKTYNKVCGKWEFILMLTTVIAAALLWGGNLTLLNEDVFYTVLATIALVFMLLFLFYHYKIEKKYIAKRYYSSSRGANLGGGAFVGATLSISIYHIVLFFL